MFFVQWVMIEILYGWHGVLFGVLFCFVVGCFYCGFLCFAMVISSCWVFCFLFFLCFLFFVFFCLF